MSRFPRWWFWAAVLVPAVVTAAGLVVQGGSIEREVEASARAAYPAARIVVNGREATISGVPVELLPEARQKVEDATGVGGVSTIEPNLAPMRILFQANEITVVGSTEQQAWRERFVGAIGAEANGRAVVDQTRTVPNTDFPITTTAAAAVVSLITQQPEDMTVVVDAGKVTVSGVLHQNHRAAIVALMRRLFGAPTVIDQTRTKE